MSRNIWTTTREFDSNWVPFGLSFPGLFDYPEYYHFKPKSAEEKEQKMQMLDKLIAITDQYHRAQKIASENIPKILYASNFTGNNQLPAFFRTIEGFLIVNAQCAQILKQFKLGQNALYPLDFFDIKQNKPIANHYYLLHILELRNYLRPQDCSEDLRECDYTNHQGYKLFNLYHANYKDEAIAVATEASNCELDLWQDPALESSIFMSDQLKTALDEAQLSKAWRLFTCKLV